MKVGILAGGAGTRFAEQTERKPKPMIEVGGKPILWHIMKHYAAYDFNAFVVALGYKGECIQEYFGKRAAGNGEAKRWKIDLVETGQLTQTGGRIKRLSRYLGSQTFMLTWGDGVSNVDLGKLLAFHRSHGKLATVTAVHPPSRFGQLRLDGDTVVEFSEKPPEEAWINGAFFVLEPQVLDYIDGDDTAWEREPMERLARDGQLRAYRHESFWQCMDTHSDWKRLEGLWNSGKAPWKSWE